MKPIIKSMIQDVRIQKTTNQSNMKKKEYQKTSEDNISSLWDNFKRSKFASQGCQRGKRKSKKLEIYIKKKTVKENFPNLVKEIDKQVQEAQRAPNKVDAKKPTPRHHN